MFNVEIPKEYRVFSVGTSDGTQDKYFFEGYWYKLDRYGGEGCAEFLSSLLLKNTSLNSELFAEYEYGIINGQSGCRSKHFLKHGESLITIYRLHHNVFGTNIGEITQAMNKEERVEYTLDFMKRYTGLELSEYFSNTFWLDQIILNEDRHYNNLSVVFSQKNGFKTAPIFDNGKSLLVGNFSYRVQDSMEDKVKKVVARPFSGSHQWNFDYFKKYCTIVVNKDRLEKELSKVPNSFEKEVLLFQLNRLGNGDT